MRAYELMVLIDPEVDDRTVEPTLEKYLEVVRSNGGTIDKVDIWGRRKMSYEIPEEGRSHLRSGELHRRTSCFG